jgi:hypothetical protein
MKVKSNTYPNTDSTASGYNCLKRSEGLFVAHKPKTSLEDLNVAVRVSWWDILESLTKIDSNPSIFSSSAHIRNVVREVYLDPFTQYERPT